MRACDHANCVEPARNPKGGHGYCAMHYRRFLKGRPMDAPKQGSHPKVCTVGTCGRTAMARGLCEMHYERWRRTGDTGPAHKLKSGDFHECSVDFCTRRSRKLGLCNMHYQRLKATGETGPAGSKKGQGHIDKHGYRILYVNGRARPEHHVVMEHAIGRPLVEHESVHHLNGVRDDNRIENLELWVSITGNHRKGQRVSDVIAFVAEHYPEAVTAAINGETQLRIPGTRPDQSSINQR